MSVEIPWRKWTPTYFDDTKRKIREARTLMGLKATPDPVRFDKPSERKEFRAFMRKMRKNTIR